MTAPKKANWPGPILPELCHALMERAPVPMAELEGEEHIVRYVNPPFCHLVGKEREALTGRPFKEIAQPGDQCLAVLDHVYRLGEPATHTQSDTESDQVEPHPAYWTYAIWPVLDANQRPVGLMMQVTETTLFHQQTREMNQQLLISSVHQHELTETAENLNDRLHAEIDERKRAEAALRESQQWLEGLVNSAMDAVITIGADQRVVLFNPGAERMFRCPSSEALGCSIERFIPERFRSAHRGHIDLFRQTGTTTRRMGALGSIHGLRANGEEFLIEASISQMVVNGQRLFTVILRDITERKRAEVALRESETHLRALAAELNLAEQRERTRLAAELHDHLQQMLALGKIKLAQGLRDIEANPAWEKLVKETNDIFSEALTYTRTLTTELSPPVLRDHGLAAGLKWLGEHMKKHDLVVTVTVPEEELKLPEDQVLLLFQSVRELLINSSKHAGTGRAAIMFEQQDDHLRIIVRDDGVGFDLAAATSVAAVSTGGLSSKFGLFSIRERMKALGGSFEIQSAPGKGTTAILTLPLHVQPAQPSSLRAASSIPQDRVEMQADILDGQTELPFKMS